jgi:Tol biopolymer transport system component
VIYVQQAGGGTYALANGYSPVWSHDGSKIAFRTWGFVGELATINPDGSGQRTIARRAGNSGCSIPRWSPSSTHLIYHRAGPTYPSDVSEVYRVTADGRSAQNLTSDLPTDFLNAARPVGWR